MTKINPICPENNLSLLKEIASLPKCSAQTLALSSTEVLFLISHQEPVKLALSVDHHLLLGLTSQKMFSFVLRFLLLLWSLFQQSDILCPPLILPILYSTANDFSHYWCSITHHLACSINGK